MTKAVEKFSPRMRQQIVRLYELGKTTRFIAEVMGASKSGVRRVRQRYRERGHADPLGHGGGQRPKRTPEAEQLLRETLARQPDLFCRELAVLLAERLGLMVHRETVGRWVRELGITRKKSPMRPPSSTDLTSSKPAARGSSV